VAATTTDQKDTFVPVPGDRHSEVARTLAEPVPQALSLFDQFGLGVSLLGWDALAWQASLKRRPWRAQVRACPP
jgi:hypothetical protein